MPGGEYVLALSCPDRVGIVHAVTGFLLDRSCNILDSQQFGDPLGGRFFMRVHLVALDASVDEARLRGDFAAVAERFSMRWELHDVATRGRVLVMVSRLGHCLNDLLFRYRSGALPGDVVAVVSNHADLEGMSRASGVPFHHLPTTPATRVEQQQRLVAIADSAGADLVVLARYMQLLSADLCARWAGRAINIHHSFLPSFRGARPYHQAHARGVKVIGATAHYVTAQLDEGPIIEQEVARVDHSLGPDELAAVGRDLESVTLARAVRWHLEHRVLLNGDRTVVFR